MNDDLCKRCGACCHARAGKIDKKCPQLVEKEGVAWCKIYLHRIGQIIGTIHNTNYYCGLRKNSDFDYPNCPYNTCKPIMKPSDQEEKL